MIVLGIETSCDETSVAVLDDDKVISNLVSSQDFHTKYGGVVPELSSRAHLQIVLPLIREALKKSGLKNEIELVAATAGPGLIGALLVGLTFGKSLSFANNIPFVPVNHIEGHIFSGFLQEEKPEFPYLCLTVSGGHTLLVYVAGYDNLRVIGSTIDDAAGEAFDKGAKMLGLGYPGGPALQNAARQGNLSIDFPIAHCKNQYDFSFSGVKTSLLRYLQSQYGNEIPHRNDIADIAASYQNAIVKALVSKTEKALKKFEVKSLSLTGGVAANLLLRESFRELAGKYGKSLIIPDLKYCGDNAAMIAYRGVKVYNAGYRYDLSFPAFASSKKMGMFLGQSPKNSE